jgi:hypothetical protein
LLDDYSQVSPHREPQPVKARAYTG